MENILNILYRGELHPEENYQPVMPELIEEKKAFAALRDALLLELDEETREKVESLLDARTLVSAYEIEDAYVQGMRLGAKMAAELLRETKEE